MKTTNGTFPKTTKPKYRLTLSKFLLVVSVICVLLAVLGQIHRRATAQHEAVLVLTETVTTSDVPSIKPQRKSNVFYDFEIETYLANRRGVLAKQPSPNPLSRWLGLDYFHRVELVEFQMPADAHLVSQLQRLPGLRRVSFDAGIGNQDAWQQLMQCKAIEQLEISVGDSKSLVKLKEIARLRHLQEITIDSGDLPQHNLLEISESSTIQTIRLIDVHLTRESLLDFPRMENVESFFWKIYFNPLDNEQFRFIENLPNMRKLALAGDSQITDEALESLRNLRQLEEISLHGTLLTGSNLQLLQELPRLVQLELGASRLNDEGLQAIARIRQLEHLEIGSTEVTDDGMAHVAKLGALRHLSIRDTAVSDVGLAKLEPLKQLHFLRLRDTKITPAGIAAFAQSNPDCLIEK